MGEFKHEKQNNKLPLNSRESFETLARTVLLSNADSNHFDLFIFFNSILSKYFFFFQFF